MAGVDESLVKPRSIAAKIAALLPFPLWRWPWRGGSSAKTAASGGGSHSAAGAPQCAPIVEAVRTYPVRINEGSVEIHVE